MEPHRLVQNACKFFHDLGLARLQCVQFGLNAWTLQSTGGEGIEESTNPALKVLLLALKVVAPVIPLASGSAYPDYHAILPLLRCDVPTRT